MDSRDQGRSGDSTAKIRFERMTDDQAALLEHLNLDAVNVGIEALLLAIRGRSKSWSQWPPTSPRKGAF